MSLLFRIVYAAHANGTHHKLALDGLRVLKGEQADAWTRLFLKHADRFMAGSKAPDDTFKDFKNHVLHVGDEFWGGAPEKAVEWYGTTVTALRESRWEDAVYAAGVLSHYYSDPIMPFHTAQTEAENAIHRATEWSINRSYGVLRGLGEERFATVAVPLRDGADWLKAMVCDGAEASNRSYEKLIAHYDIHRGVTDPPAGLDGIARGIVAELLMFAATGYGRILERALAEAKVAPPEVSLTLDTVMAAIKIPAKALAKRLSNAGDRAIVEAMYDELKATGRVDKTLPEDDRMVRDLHAKEVLVPKQAKLAAARAARLKAAPPIIAAAPKLSPAVAVEVAKRTEAALTGTTNIPAVPPRGQPAAPQVNAAPVSAQPPKPVPGLPPQVASAASGLVSRLAATPPSAPTPTPPAKATSVPTIGPATADRTPRIYLSPGDQLEAAPSIGPKMAERFAALGILTVGDFLTCNPDGIAGRLADRRIDGAQIEQWQAQARLVMSIAGLRGTHAQLLTGAGYRSAAVVASADPVKLSAEVLAFAGSSEGKRVLRDGPAPEAEKIKDWVAMARAAQKAA